MLAIREINELYQEIESAGKVMIDKAIRIGELLTEQKASMGHGGWIPWVEENLPFDRVQAAKYMRVHAHKNELNETSSVHLTDAITSLAKPKPAHVSHSTGEREWFTPPEYIEAARKVMGSIDIDPASCEEANKTVNATRYYTAENDGLTQKWKGTVWLNPPYDHPIVDEFCQTLVGKVKKGETLQACIIVNNITETAAGQTLLSNCNAICFPRGRVRFFNPTKTAKNSPLQGQMVLYFGKKADIFCSEFAEFGVCFHG